MTRTVLNETWVQVGEAGEGMQCQRDGGGTILIASGATAPTVAETNVMKIEDNTERIFAAPSNGDTFYARTLHGTASLVWYAV